MVIWPCARANSTDILVGSLLGDFGGSFDGALEGISTGDDEGPSVRAVEGILAESLEGFSEDMSMDTLVEPSVGKFVRALMGTTAGFRLGLFTGDTIEI